MFPSPALKYFSYQYLQGIISLLVSGLHSVSIKKKRLYVGRAKDSFIEESVSKSKDLHLILRTKNMIENWEHRTESWKVGKICSNKRLSTGEDCPV